MEFREVTILTSIKGLSVLTKALEAIGASGFVINDPTDFEDFLAGTQTHWDYVEESLMDIKDSVPYVRFYAPMLAQGDRLIENTKKYLDELRLQEDADEYGELSMSIKDVKESDWENNWKAYFKPFKVGQNFYIKPSWETLDDREGRLVLEIDPASSFGTGTHETTRLCLAACEDIIIENKTVLDMGCGSGILSVGAFALGAKEITLVDIDENCALTSRENLERNAVEASKYEIICDSPDRYIKKLQGRNYDVILANIVADVIIGLAKDFKAWLNEGGTLITSGIIDGRQDDVVNALKAAGFKIEKVVSDNNWTCVVAS